MKTQLCLLSGELMPNVIGVLHSGVRQVLPIVSRESAAQVDSFRQTLAATGNPVTVLDPVTVLPFDPTDCVNTLSQAIGVHPDLEINWTGGTKIMSYAVRQLAERHGLPALYVNTNGREILRENPADGSVQSEMIDTARLGLNVLTHILAAGHTVEGGESLEAFRTRCTPAPELVQAATLILDARPSERYELRELAKADRAAFQPQQLNADFLKALTQAGLIEPAADAGKFFLAHTTKLHPFHRQSPEEQNAIFLRSTYLEVFLWSQIKERSAIEDVAWHVALNPGVRGRAAELDVALAHEGRFVVLECKQHLDLKELAKVIEEQAARTRRIGRLFGRWMLYIHHSRAEYDAPGSDAIIASQAARAADYGGKLLWHDDLKDLPVTVATFLNEGRLTL